MDIVSKAQKFLAHHQIDGWLLYYFNENNPLALEILDIKSGLISRRFFYYIPKEGSPVKIVHQIEKNLFLHLPGLTLVYDSSDTLIKALKTILEKPALIAMEYSPLCKLPYISKVDAGTVELVESFNVKVVSSANFIIHFTSVLSKRQIESQKEAANFLNLTCHQLFYELQIGLKNKLKITEAQVAECLDLHFIKHGFKSDHRSICAFGKNSADPHYVPQSVTLKENQVILLDVFCKKDSPEAIYADIAKMGFSGLYPIEEYQNTFSIVKSAQKLTFEFLKKELEKEKSVRGCDIDAFCRSYLKQKNVAEFFTHRTGHNIYKTIHGPGTHIDSFETLDERPLIPSTCFSLEPGLYYPDKFGVRLEFDVIIDQDNHPIITGEQQEEIVCFNLDKKALTFDKIIH